MSERTPLHRLHVELDGRMVDFAGWDLPIQYEGVIAEHTWCRTSAALFDVSHMGLIEIQGDNPAASLERVNPAGLTTLKPGAIRYGFLLNDDGGVIDDLMVTNNGSHFSAVINASRRDVDVAYLRDRLDDVDIIERPETAILAVQGPKAVDAVSRLAPAAADLFFLQSNTVEMAGTEIGISRSGYTGEDGYELLVPAEAAEAVARLLLDQPEVKPAGLGARDTLRLEAGLCLYGNDLDESVSPIEADLRWAIPKRRREAKDYPGATRIMAEYNDGPARVRVGLAADGRRPVREHSTLHHGGEAVGEVTSGGFGPTVDRPVAMGFVPPALAEIGTQLIADVRGKEVPITVAPLPFAPHGYHRAPKN